MISSPLFSRVYSAVVALYITCRFFILFYLSPHTEKDGILREIENSRDYISRESTIQVVLIVDLLLNIQLEKEELERNRGNKKGGGSLEDVKEIHFRSKRLRCP